jgi:SpoVK/Ycf46/Vps4 family AAA+-type ATPase
MTQLEESRIIHPNLSRAIEAGRPLIAVITPEEGRLEAMLRELAETRGQTLWTWRTGIGLERGASGPLEGDAGLESALTRLAAEEADEPIVWIKDPLDELGARETRRLRDLYRAWRGRKAIALLSMTENRLPKDLEREISVVQIGMPGSAELRQLILRWQEENQRDLALDLDVAVGALKGLTLDESWHALTRVQRGQHEGDELLMVLQEEKRQLIQKLGTIEYIPRVPGLDDLGGLENLKDWLIKRKKLMLSDSNDLREITPKGLLLMGVSGCGKSLCIKAISSAWRLPLYRLEMVRVFSGAYGNPEIAFAEACRKMEEMAPAVLWIDEIEMGLSASGSEAANSALGRIFAFFLTWMQEKTPGLFVAASANRIDLLPAEMIRKGRFDQVFFVDLPVVSEREHIFRIHLQRRGYDPERFNLEVFADGTEGWSGAEIEQAVISAITNAKMEGRDLELKDLYAARKQIVPISTTMEEQVRHIRNWAYDRAVRASKDANER